MHWDVNASRNKPEGFEANIRGLSESDTPGRRKRMLHPKGVAGTGMPRGAIALSCVIHAVIILFIIWLCPSISGRGGSGQTESDTSLLADDSAGSLFAATVTVTEPTSQPLSEPQPQFTVPDCIPPLPVEVFSAQPISAFVPIPPQLPLAAFPPLATPLAKADAAPKNGNTNHSTRPRSSENSGIQRGSGAGEGGNGAGKAGYVPPQFLLRYKPTYPEEARAARLEGTVLLLVSIGTDGHVTGSSVQSSCGHPVLDRAALQAVRSWRFYPARQDGRAIATRVEVPVRFRFEERSVAYSN